MNRLEIPKLGLQSGQGTHIHLNLHALDALGLPYWYAKHFPKFEWQVRAAKELRILNKEPKRWPWQRRFEARWYRLLQGATLGREFQALKNAVRVDAFTAKHWEGLMGLWAWNLYGLQTMQRVKARGGKVLLEIPFTHADTYNARLHSLYDEAGIATHRPFLLPEVMLQRYRQEYAIADKIRVLSSFAQVGFIAQGFSPEKLIKVPLAVDTAQFTPGPELPLWGNSRPFTVVYVGRITLLKGVHKLLEAFAAWPQKNARLKLVGATFPDIQPWLAKADERVSVLGSVPRNQLKKAYQAADLAVFPSLNDSFGMVGLEAMACGLPLVASPYSLGPDVIRNGQDGVVIEPTTETLVEVLEDYYRNPERCRYEGGQAVQRVREAFSLQRYTERVREDILPNILST